MVSEERPDHLRERLIQEALDLLREEGVEPLSLRRLARRAGVSHGAPLRHFRSVADLRAEVAAHGFDLLTESLEKSGAALPPGADVQGRMHAAGRAYVRIAVENAGLFALMFRPEDLDPSNTNFMRASSAAFDRLLAHVRIAQDAGWHADRDTRLLAGSVWSVVHGLASLWSQGAFHGPVPNASLDDAIEMTLALAFNETKGLTHE
jgi:AcrR family transcriptional regulator